MSVLIKGIELPEKVQVLELHSDGKVFTRKGYLVGEAVELPDHHGRLVDADALLDEIAVMPIDIGFGDVDRVEDIIREMPTIVESEGESCEK